MNCTLCNSKTVFFYEVNNKHYFRCKNCDAVLLDTAFFISSEAEKERYQLHQNNVEDAGYQQFVSPILDAVLSDFSSEEKGLDFGSGTGPVISTLLQKKGFAITTYDPFFDNNTKALKKTYNFIVCCEVVEHFYHPNKEFKLLKRLLKPNGKLYCMTTILRPNIDFKSWYYKNDPTHVIFYSEKTMHFIAKHFGFGTVTIEKNLIVFEE